MVVVFGRLENWWWKVRRWLGPNTYHLQLELSLWCSMSLLLYATLWNHYGMHHVQASSIRYVGLTIVWLSRHWVYRILCTTGYSPWLSWISAGHYFDVPYRNSTSSSKHVRSNNNNHNSSSSNNWLIRRLVSWWYDPYPSLISSSSSSSSFVLWIQDYYWKYAPPLQWCVAVGTSIIIGIGYCHYYQDEDDFLLRASNPLGFLSYNNNHNYKKYDSSKDYWLQQQQNQQQQYPSAIHILFRLGWWNTIMSIVIYGRLIYPLLDLKKSSTDTTHTTQYYSDPLMGSGGGSNSGGSSSGNSGGNSNHHHSSLLSSSHHIMMGSHPILSSSSSSSHHHNKHHHLTTSTTFIFFSLIYGPSYTQQWMAATATSSSSSSSRRSTTGSNNHHNINSYYYYSRNQYTMKRWAEHYQSIQHVTSWKLYWHWMVLRVLEYVFAIAFLPTTHFACQATHHCDVQSHIYHHLYRGKNENAFLAPTTLPGWIIPYLVMIQSLTMLLLQMYTLDRNNIGWSIRLSNKHRHHTNNSTSSDSKNYNNNNGFGSNKQQRNKRSHHHHHPSAVSASSSSSSSSSFVSLLASSWFLPKERNDRRILNILQSLWSIEMIGAPSSSQLLYQLRNIHSYHTIGLSILFVYSIYHHHHHHTNNNNTPTNTTTLPPPLLPILVVCFVSIHICRLTFTYQPKQQKKQLTTVCQELSTHYQNNQTHDDDDDDTNNNNDNDNNESNNSPSPDNQKQHSTSTTTTSPEHNTVNDDNL